MNGQAEIPSFSIIVETENLSLADLSRLSESLQSLADQDVPIERAVDILVQDSGNVSPTDLAKLQRRFPWISLFEVAHEVGHYEAKMQCVERVHGDVVVFCDCDCRYQPGWLRHLLVPFSTDESIQLVGGETQMEATSAFGLAMLLTHVFSPYSGHSELYSSDGYSANNVAFRREFLQSHPIPVHLSLYRGNCVVHARSLGDQGITIWKQPHARAVHALPENPAHVIYRFPRMGGDALQVARITSAGDRRGAIGVARSALGVIYGKLREAVTRGRVQWRRQPRPVVQFALAAPIIVLAQTLFIAGVLAKSVHPGTFSGESNHDGKSTRVVGSSAGP